MGGDRDTPATDPRARTNWIFIRDIMRKPLLQTVFPTEASPFRTANLRGFEDLKFSM
ncbi:hypothetical protein PGT21_014340 [Puccinia graminis f. sp. tritici]|uniref:Uncharacterized protein n=1 Tax=Puccinia graminis f. sp. tritici TaxID=56615 RepID=A0A5B0P1F3_PUCGR|nr:hypothetical protein PGT21_014340 [Puccinia graminis f. sp. tritici]